MNLRNKLEALIAAANTTTGQSDTDLTSAVQHLKDGFGIGESLGGGYNIIVTENEDGSQNLAIVTVAGETNSGGLPSGYTQLEFIQSSGSQYIDTGYVPRYGTKYEIEYEWVSFINGENKVAGSANSLGTALSYPRTSGNYIAPFFCNSEINLDPSASRAIGVKFKGVADLTTTTAVFTAENLDTGVVSTGSKANAINYNAVDTLYLFKDHTNIWPYPSNSKIYSLKIWDSNVLVRNMIPAMRNSDSEIGLYNLVNNVFYTNLGTGTFTYGELIAS